MITSPKFEAVNVGGRVVLGVVYWLRLVPLIVREFNINLMAVGRSVGWPGMG